MRRRRQRSGYRGCDWSGWRRRRCRQQRARQSNRAGGARHRPLQRRRFTEEWASGAPSSTRKDRVDLRNQLQAARRGTGSASRSRIRVKWCSGAQSSIPEAAPGVDSANLCSNGAPATPARHGTRFELIVEMICECQGDTISGAPQLGKLNTQFFAVGWPVLMASSLMADARSWTTRSSTSQFFIQRSRSSMPAGYEKENAC